MLKKHIIYATCGIAVVGAVAFVASQGVKNIPLQSSVVMAGPECGASWLLNKAAGYTEDVILLNTMRSASEGVYSAGAIVTVQNAVDTYVACQQQQNVVVANDESGEDAAIDTFDLQGSQLTSALLTAGQTVTAITTACNRTYLDQHHTPYTTDKANYDSHINELHNIPNGMFAVLQAYETCESRVIAEEAAIAEAVRCFDISTNLPSVKNNSGTIVTPIATPSAGASNNGFLKDNIVIDYRLNQLHTDFNAWPDSAVVRVKVLSLSEGQKNGTLGWYGGNVENTKSTFIGRILKNHNYLNSTAVGGDIFSHKNASVNNTVYAQKTNNGIYQVRYPFCGGIVMIDLEGLRRRVVIPGTPDYSLYTKGSQMRDIMTNILDAYTVRFQPINISTYADKGIYAKDVVGAIGQKTGTWQDNMSDHLKGKIAQFIADPNTGLVDLDSLTFPVQ